MSTGKKMPAKLKPAAGRQSKRPPTAQRSLVQNQKVRDHCASMRTYDVELGRLQEALWSGAAPGSVGSDGGRHPASAGSLRPPAAPSVQPASQVAPPGAGTGSAFSRACFFSSSFTCRRVGLALGGFHGLADQRVEGLVLAGAVFLDRLGVGGHAPRRGCRSSSPVSLIWLQAHGLDQRIDASRRRGIRRPAAPQRSRTPDLRAVVRDGAVGDARDQRWRAASRR